MNKKLILLALVIFVVTAGMAVAVNSLLGTGLRFDYTISRYVGLEVWSAVVFAFGNFVVAGMILYYLYEAIQVWKMPRLAYWCVVIMLIGLIGLSVCPIGYFDPVGAKYGTSVISLIHGLCSRTMFVTMMVMMAVVALNTMASKTTRILGVVFIVYGLMCLCGHLSQAEWFTSTVLVTESLYLISFMVLCFGFKGKENDVRAKR